MRVVDTSAWIEWLRASPTAAALTEHWPNAADTVVPTLVQLELAKWLTREVSEEAADQAIAYTMGCLVAPLETRIALRAAEICRTHKLATADAIIYATALDLGADCLTCDSHFEGLPDVVLVPKGKSG
ncbi:type II toxin-antitoxin system VapC family toxin [Phreatobacter stygius]|uniref:Ribonuclease VapC n=1 Tax=Phreatobacter stygius TaxID=1940610 RepID=A0A4D7ARX6_9HYPH|nr:type II toxin-antitoxin system VapC family toxin [Phreatobacter stygius]QCI64184.1 type II toxin-antitoxin system VapC family toxin [Phreatobacter stygius]